VRIGDGTNNAADVATASSNARKRQKRIEKPTKRKQMPIEKRCKNYKT
jgi:hypothetical protein